ncbi:MAG: hypothetical protein US53_C0044G0001, partial [Candidatus Woesebacteria bacterium GW2011_GWA1_37_7]
MSNEYKPNDNLYFAGESDYSRALSLFANEPHGSGLYNAFSVRDQFVDITPLNGNSPIDWGSFSLDDASNKICEVYTFIPNEDPLEVQIYAQGPRYEVALYEVDGRKLPAGEHKNVLITTVDDHRNQIGPDQDH